MSGDAWQTQTRHHDYQTTESDINMPGQLSLGVANLRAPDVAKFPVG
jgi:hypothetical protein